MASFVKQGLEKVGQLGELIVGSKTQKPIRCLMVGLNDAGKTTILYRLVYGNDAVIPDVGPSMGVNIETIEHEGARLTIWDASGNDKIRGMWGSYCASEEGQGGVDALIWVADMADDMRMEASRQLLRELLKDEEGLADALILVYANKIDRPDTMSNGQLESDLGLRAAAMKARQYKIQRCCGLTGEGLREGLEWVRMMVHTH